MGSQGPQGRRARGAGNNRSIQLNADKVRAVRRAKGMSRAQLAESGRGTPDALTEITITRVERAHPVYLSTAGSLARLLGVTLSELCDDEPEEPRPMIAVMPLRAPDGETTDFADGLAEDLITRISRAWFPVLARASTIDRSASDPQVAARALGARYWVDGSVRRSGSKLRITAQLADARSGAVIARFPYECMLDDVFARQDELAAAVTSELHPPLLVAETRRAEYGDPTDLEAWQEALLGAACFYRRTAPDNARARELLTRALRRDPKNALAWYTLALTHQQDLINQWTHASQASIAELRVVTSAFADHYAGDAWSEVASAYLDVYEGRRASAMDRLQGAIDDDPNTCLAYALYGQTLAMAQRPDEGLEQFETALRLNPRDSERWSTLTGMALAHFVAERYEDAVDHAKQALRVRHRAAFPYAVLASAEALRGNRAEARVALQAMHELQPNMSTSGIQAIMSSTDPDIGKRYLEGLRRAGLRG